MKSNFFLSLLLGTTLAYPHKNAKQTCDRLPDVGLTPIEMIASHGYPTETHYVTTDDSYIVTLFRIPHGREDPDPSAKRPAVLLNHGMGFSAADYVNMGPARSLSYLLADRGYDVWLLNARGTLFSRNHTTLDPEQPTDRAAYFDFSWHEIGVYDLPAAIDHILALNGAAQLHYVGHSQGGTSFYAMAADRPEYNAKIALATLLAPAGGMAPHQPLLALFSKFIDPFANMLKHMNMYEMPFMNVLRGFITKMCPLKEFQSFCAFFFSMVGGGSDEEQIDWEYIDVIGTNTPSTFAMKQLVHYAQLIKSTEFNHFDYGRNQNKELYGQSRAPAYDLSKIVAPVAVYYGPNDKLTHFDDIKRMIELLPNVVQASEVPCERFNHIDFIFAHDVVDLLYNEVITVMQKYKLQ